MVNPIERAVTRWGILAVVALAGAIGGAGSSSAIPIFLTIYDTMGQPWTMSTDDPRVKVLQDTTDRTGLPPNSQTTSVRKVVEFDSMEPIKISFTQDNFATVSYGGAARNTTVRSGLNFDMQNIVFNLTPFTWTGFAETATDRDLLKQGVLIIDATVPESFGEGVHPAKSHFHPIIGTDPPSLNPASWDLLNDVDGAAMVLYGGSPNVLATGGEFNFNVKVHDIVVMDYKRRFDLLEIPVPAPATLALLAIGLAALGAGLGKKAAQGTTAA